MATASLSAAQTGTAVECDVTAVEDDDGRAAQDDELTAVEDEDVIRLMACRSGHSCRQGRRRRSPSWRWR